MTADVKIAPGVLFLPHLCYAISVMQVVEMMKTHVVKTTPDASLGEAVDLMDLYQVGSLPVVDAEGALCGMLSESDVLRALLDGVPPPETFSESQAMQVLGAGGASAGRIAAYMTQPALSISEHAEGKLAARLLLASGFKRLPVVDEHNRVVGVLNRIDVIQAVFENTL